jgi:hypothetical protein
MEAAGENRQRPPVPPSQGGTPWDGEIGAFFSFNKLGIRPLGGTRPFLPVFAEKTRPIRRGTPPTGEK